MVLTKNKVSIHGDGAQDWRFGLEAESWQLVLKEKKKQAQSTIEQLIEIGLIHGKWKVDYVDATYSTAKSVVDESPSRIFVMN